MKTRDFTLICIYLENNMFWYTKK